MAWALCKYGSYQRNEPHHEKERVKISNETEFESCRPNTHGMVDI